MRKLLNPHQKAKIAIAALRNDKTYVQLSSEYQVHASQISEWKISLEKEAHIIFGNQGHTKLEQRIAELERLVGQRDIELEWMKKKLRIPDTQ